MMVCNDVAKYWNIWLMWQNMVFTLYNILPHWNILLRNIFVTGLKYIMEYFFLFMFKCSHSHSHSKFLNCNNHLQLIIFLHP